MTDAGRRWLEDQHPLDDARSQAQIDALLAQLGPTPKRVVDLGCGIGRTLAPLAQAGHRLVGIDTDAVALRECAATLHAANARAELIEADFRTEWRRSWTPADMACCLGNTFMLVADPDEAVDLLAKVAEALRPEGVLVIDDCPGDYWSELTEGNWQSGLSPDGALQLVWARDDARFALRHGDDIDTERWTPDRSDTALRLWTMGALRLAARAAGLSGPERLPGTGLLLMRPAPRADARDSNQLA